MSAAAAYARRYREDDMPSRQYIPSTDDPRWERWSAPLLEYIQQCPRTWGDLHEWEEANNIRPGLLLALVSWLEFYDRIHAVGEGVPIIWAAGSKTDEKET